MLTAKEIAASESIHNIKLSKDASRVVYCVGPRNRAGDHTTSALWLAETFKAESAKQITSGTFDDSSPQFHPNGSSILFLSDRHKAGGPSQIYQLTLSNLSAEPFPLTSIKNTKGVASFSISPDGVYVAFISQDEPGINGEEPISDAKIWGERINLGRLRVIDLRHPGKG